jgi:hypothetical protein
MYDSTTAGDCPADGDLYAGYVDGEWADYAAMVEAFPGKVHVRIAVNAFGPVADVLDVESGDATPQQCAGWRGRMRAASKPLSTYYCNRSNADAVAANLQAAGVSTDEAALWLATGGDPYDGPWEVRGYRIVAVQDRTSEQTGGHYDASTVYDDHWPATAPAQATAPTQPLPAPREFPGDDVKITLGTIHLDRDSNTGRIEGRFALPQGLNAGSVVGVNVINQTPSEGHYGPVPWYKGIDPEPDENGCHGLIFSGQTPDGDVPAPSDFGFTYSVPSGA